MGNMNAYLRRKLGNFVQNICHVLGTLLLLELALCVSRYLVAYLQVLALKK